MEAFGDMRVIVNCRWGEAPVIAPTRGVPQGSVSGPEEAKAAQEPILRVRESSPACYMTSAGRRVPCAGYVDDAEHYGSGVSDLPKILAELGSGSIATGIGFAWAKFSAFASDWDERAAHGDAAVSDEGVAVTGWDIWRGGLCNAVVPRARADTIEKLLGKRGTIRDRHSLASADVVSKLAKVRSIALSRRASWEEVATMAQLINRGILGYSPLHLSCCPCITFRRCGVAEAGSCWAWHARNG